MNEELNSYYIMKNNIGKYKYIVTCTGYENSINFIEDIEEDLCKNNYNGNVLLDLYLSHGHPAYVEAEFKDGCFINKSFKEIKVQDISKEILDKLTLLYRNNPSWVKLSNLPNGIKWLITESCLTNKN